MYTREMIETAVWWLPEGRGSGIIRLKEVKYMVAEGDLRMDDGHTMQYTDHVAKKFILDTYIIL